MPQKRFDFNRAEFTVAAARIGQLPEDSGREVAFAGRSNAGKSSALNAITGRRGLARVSKTPGRTQQLVVFDLGEDARLIDLPGYGYAKVPERIMEQWRKTMEDYFRTRRSLAGLVLIMDVRHPLREFDWQMLAFCEYRRLPVHVLLTKADKLKRGRCVATERAVIAELESEGFGATVQLFSAPSRQGVDAARQRLEEWLLGGEPANAS